MSDNDNGFVNASAHLNKDEQDNMPLMHVYPQYDNHGEAFIVANKDALLKLKEAIDNAINTGRGSAGLFAADGEGYDFRVICNDEGWQSSFWSNISFAYTAEWTKDLRKGTHPSEIWYHST